MLYQCGSNPKSWWQKWKGGDLKTHKHTSTTETKRCKESITGSSQLITYIPVSLFKLIKFWYITLCIGRVLRWPPKFVVSREHILYNPSPWVWQDMYLWGKIILKIQFSSVTQSCPTLCDPMNLSTTGKPGMLQPMGSQRIRHDWVTELNWASRRDQSQLLSCPVWGFSLNPLDLLGSLVVSVPRRQEALF